MFDYREFDNALRGRDVSAECPRCGGTERLVPTQPVALLELGTDLRVKPEPSSGAVTATFCGATICEHCGFVCLHALVPLGLEPPELRRA